MSIVTCLSIGIGLALSVGLWSASGVSAERGPNPYPFGKSTYWAWQNRPDLPANLGAAKDWNDNAALQGWPVSAFPRTGDIAVFEPGVLGSDRNVGHVAVVRQVFDSGAYTATEMDEADCQGNSTSCGRVNTRQYPNAPGTSFIHYLKDTRTTWGFAAGAAGWTPVNLGMGTSDGSGWYYPLIGSSPQLVSPDLDIPLSAYNVVEIQMAVSQNVSNTTLQLYFATADQPQFSTNNRALLRAVPDGSLHKYVIYFGAHTGWSGQLTRLRLDPTGAGAAGGVRIERISLVHEEASTFAAMAGLRGSR